MRNIEKIYPAESGHWVGNGFYVQQLFSHLGGLNRGTDPFLMLDYAMPYEFAPNMSHPRGVDAHPHKGFETVTIVYHGEVAHRDSTGAGGVIGVGDVQWMTAGSGIIHEEFHSNQFSQSGGLFEMVQLWVNLPAKAKNIPPRYQHLSASDIPVIENENSKIRLIAGHHDGQNGLAETQSELNVWDMVIYPEKALSLPIPNHHNVSLVILRGQPKVNGETVGKGQLVRFNGAGEIVIESNNEETKALLLSGVPLNEPVSAYGPFVMNTPEEIRQALQDYRDGKFGRIDE